MYVQSFRPPSGASQEVHVDPLLKNPVDPLSYASAWLALVPQGLVVVYVTLMWASREIEILLMFAGQMACEILNFALKRLIREERPKRTLTSAPTLKGRALIENI